VARGTFALDITVDDLGLQDLVGKLEPAGIKGVLKNIGEEGVQLTLKAFRDQRNPDTGKKWAPLKPETIKRRRGTGTVPLQRTRELRNSFHWELVDGGSAVSIGTPYPFFKYHQHLPENAHLDHHIMPRREAFPNQQPLPKPWATGFLDAVESYLDL